MTSNPLQFESEFARLKSRLSGRTDGNVALLTLVAFWPRVQPLCDRRAFSSYVEEYLGLILDHALPEQLVDLSPEELQEISESLSGMVPVAGRFELEQKYQAASQAVRTERGRKLLHAGDLALGLAAFMPQAFKLEGQMVSALEEIPTLADEFDALRLFITRVGPGDDPFWTHLRSFAAEWEVVREGTSREYANCLFVDKGTGSTGGRGRMRELACQAEYRSANSTSHEVTFEHQIKSPDDPFVGVTYDALSAVIAFLGQPGQVRPRARHVHAHYRIRDSNHAFTGDSIGLAVALVAYTQLLKQEVLRQERGVALGAAFTGGLDRGGRLLAVADDTLPAKVQRVFFSPVKLLVVPAANIEPARTVLAVLQDRYPRRQLKLLPARNLGEVIGDHNVIRSEKVCAGQYVARKAYRIGRLTRIQVPMLLSLLYALFCVIHPPAWIGFDRNPAFVWINEAHDRILVCNQDSTVLWSREPACVPSGKLRGVAYDLDGEGSREVLYLVGPSEGVACSAGVNIYVLNSDGGSRLVLPAAIVGEYPGDTAVSQYYLPRDLMVLELAGRPYIVASILESNPARTHITVWTATGERVGWYVHAGHMRCFTGLDVNGDGGVELVGLAVNNRVKGMGFLVLPLVGCYGVSPPYSDPDYDLSGVTPGNQLRYILFPTSDLARADSQPYELHAEVAQPTPGILRLDVGLAPLILRSFYLDSTLFVTGVSLSDHFWSRRQTFVAGGLLPAISMDSYAGRERDQVLYWTADGWRTGAELATD